MSNCCFSCHLYGALEEKTDAPQLQVGPDWVWRGGGLSLQFWLFAFHRGVALTLPTLPRVPGRVPSFRRKENPYTWTIWGFCSKGMTSPALLPWERNCIATKCELFFFFEVCSGVTPSSVGMEYTAQTFCWAGVRVPRAKDLVHHTHCCKSEMSALKLIKLQRCKKKHWKIPINFNDARSSPDLENTSGSIARHVGLRHGEGHGVEVVEFFCSS